MGAPFTEYAATIPLTLLTTSQYSLTDDCIITTILNEVIVYSFEMTFAPSIEHWVGMFQQQLILPISKGFRFHF
jgi:hypothetical protein